ncbi:uncharacterized protein LOC144078039 isoform X1 [Stigmatopora argus]
MRVHPKEEVKAVEIDEKTKEVKAEVVDEGPPKGGGESCQSRREVVDDVRPKCFRVHPKEEVKAVEIDEKTKEVKAEVVDEGPPKGGGESCQNRREDQRSRG